MYSKLLSTTDIEKIIARKGFDQLLDDLITRLKNGFKELERSNTLIPTRSGIQYSNPSLGLIEWMPASIGEGTATLKLVGYHPQNPIERHLPTVISSICCFDTSSGHLKGILDGTFLTALRTGAMSAVATSILANKENSSTLGIIGCGAQSVTQAHALSRILDFTEILVYDTNEEAQESLPSRISFLDIPVNKIKREDIKDLLEHSDVLCTCTSEEPGKGPLFADFVNKDWLHINAVGSDFPGKYELPIELLERSLVFPDFYDQAIAEGECQQLENSQISDELPNLLNKPDYYRDAQNKLTVFDSTGHAYADYITSLLFMDYADQYSLGTEFELECIPKDPKDPYSFVSKTVLNAPSTTG